MSAIGIKMCFVRVTVISTAFVLDIEMTVTVCCIDIAVTVSGIVVCIPVAGQHHCGWW